jgi:hypothetical protein
MASHRDAERDIAPDEREPLLGPGHVHREARTPSEESESSPKPEKLPPRTGEYVWKGCLLVFAILITAVFVKGWIDADDVNVSLLSPLHMLHKKLIT